TIVVVRIFGLMTHKRASSALLGLARQERTSGLNRHRLAPSFDRLRPGPVLGEPLQKPVQYLVVLLLVRNLVSGLVVNGFGSEILHHDAPVTVVNREITRRFGAGIEVLVEPHVRRHEERSWFPI